MKLYLFRDLLDAWLRHDTGPTFPSVVDTHPTGRVGRSITLPDTLLDKQGGELTLRWAGHPNRTQRGIVVYGIPGLPSNEAFLLADDFMPDQIPVPLPQPPVPIPPTPQPGETPEQTIAAVWATGQHELLTKDGCGTFTEACCQALHDRLDLSYGHVRKTGAQNQYHGHAVDALQRLVPVDQSGIFDIITNSESPNAKPAYNRAGDTRPDLWYYPA